MKKLILAVLFLSITTIGSDSLEKIYKTFQKANSAHVYDKAKKNVYVFSNQEYESQAEEFKTQFVNYGAYVIYQINQNNILVNAVNAKILIMQTELLNDNIYTNEEKNQYNSDLEKIKQ